MRYHSDSRTDVQPKAHHDTTEGVQTTALSIKMGRLAGNMLVIYVILPDTLGSLKSGKKMHEQVKGPVAAHYTRHIERSASFNACASKRWCPTPPNRSKGAIVLLLDITYFRPWTVLVVD